ncbi:MAG: M28 family metallopeptidase [Acidobacteriaceae bacterium]|nr:M28 family metallopeptidase [Acidobacteriaceae bacterium]
MQRPQKLLASAFLSLLATLPAAAQTTVFGYADFSQQAKWDSAFMAVPDPTLAGQHLKELTKAPHWASSPEDKATADYVAEKFRAAGLKTEIVPYRVLLNKPVKIEISAKDANGKLIMSGPTPEHVDPKAYGGDPYQDDPRVLTAFNGSSPSGDVTADAVYANYGTREDFDELEKLGVSVRGKIVLVRYGANFRGIKVYIAQQRGAAGVLIYSDPADDGYARGDVYPRGGYHPETAFQRGSVQFLPIYPGDPQTPGVASTVDLPDSKRLTDPAKMNQPSIPANPISYHDAAPILEALNGPNVPREWQGALPFAYHLGGTDAVKVHMHLEQDYKIRTIWDVIGTIPGSDPEQKDAWVVAGNHRDAWVYGAVDPNSGTAAMLESVHGLGQLLKQGWKPKRTIVVASWDAEEEGLIGSTEWAEDNAKPLSNAVAYFNTDVGVAGPEFDAAAVPSLMDFVRDVARQVPSPAGGTVYENWLKSDQENLKHRRDLADAHNQDSNEPRADKLEVAHVGVLGSGSDYTPFIQHLGVPSTDVGSRGPYGVYHSVFDNYNWFIKNADPHFLYEQEMARVFGLEILHMADADVLPYDYRLYGHDVLGYVAVQQKRADHAGLTLNWTDLDAAAKHFSEAGIAAYQVQTQASKSYTPAERAKLNKALRDAESALLNEKGLPKRPFYRHTIYAPGEFTGYAAVVIPGVTEGIDAKDTARTQEQIDALAAALHKSASILDSATK